MEIIGDMIIFKSVEEFFIKEKSGIKANTVRIPKSDERNDIIKSMNKLKQITIINTETGESFVRRLTDISVYMDIIIFSWSQVTIWTM